MNRLLIEEDSSNQFNPWSYLKKLVLKVVLNVIYPICIIVPTASIAMICWSNGSGSLLTWHLFLTGIGFHLIMPTGISSLRVLQPLLPFASCTRKTIHWLLQSVASAFAVTGVVLQYINREMKHKHNHFATVHSIVGLLSVVLVVVSLVSGVVALLGWPKLRQFVRPAWLYRIHRAVGAAGFSTGMIALALAYEKRIFREHFFPETRFALTIALGVTVLVSLLGLFKKIASVWFNAVQSDGVSNDV